MWLGEFLLSACLLSSWGWLPSVSGLVLATSTTCASMHALLPARASEQGNVIGLVSVYIYIYISESTVVLSM